MASNLLAMAFEKEMLDEDDGGAHFTGDIYIYISCDVKFVAEKYRLLDLPPVLRNPFVDVHVFRGSSSSRPERKLQLLVSRSFASP